MKNVVVTGDSIRKNLAALWGSTTELPGTWRHGDYIIWDAPAHGNIRMYPSDAVNYTIIIYDAHGNNIENIQRYIDAVQYLKGNLKRTSCLILKEGPSLLVNNVIRKCKQAGIKCMCVDAKEDQVHASGHAQGHATIPTLEQLLASN